MPSPLRIALFGATGTAGQATAAALTGAGHAVTCLQRSPSLPLDHVTLDVTDAAAVRRVLDVSGPFDAVVSCLASRTGAPADAWAIDHAANLNLLRAAKATGIPKFILLSAICVQKPMLAFQHAKLAFEDALIQSGLDYSIVRPTAFFKSLSGQVERVRNGKPFMVFADGTLTACKPLSDADLGQFIAACVTNPDRRNRILPIGGPGPALSPRDQGMILFDLLGQQPRFRHVPVRLLDTITAGLRLGSRLVPGLKAKADLARIGSYYATESMLLWDPEQGRYDADATPETGHDTLADHYDKLLSGARIHTRGDHSVF